MMDRANSGRSFSSTTSSITTATDLDQSSSSASRRSRRSSTTRKNQKSRSPMRVVASPSTIMKKLFGNQVQADFHHDEKEIIIDDNSVPETDDYAPHHYGTTDDDEYDAMDRSQINWEMSEHGVSHLATTAEINAIEDCSEGIRLFKEKMLQKKPKKKKPTSIPQVQPDALSRSWHGSRGLATKTKVISGDWGLEKTITTTKPSLSSFFLGSRRALDTAPQGKSHSSLTSLKSSDNYEQQEEEDAALEEASMFSSGSGHKIKTMTGKTMILEPWPVKIE